MKRIIVYAIHPLRAHDVHRLKALIGPDFDPAPGVPFRRELNDDDANELRRSVEGLRLPSGAIEMVVVEPGDSGGVDRDAARSMISTHPKWQEFLAAAGGSAGSWDVLLREHEDYWLGVARFDRTGIPPGIGFVIDKRTGLIFPTRYIDVTDLNGNLL